MRKASRETSDLDPIGCVRLIGYPESIDGTRLLQTARRVAGLTQAELAERAGTSQATLSAYERGAKSPALKVAERILHAAGLELSVRTHVDFKQHKVPGLEAFWVPNQLWSVGPPDCFTTLHVPDIINHTSQTDWDLSDRTDRTRAYEILIRWALPEWMIRWIDGALLVDLWDELELPDEIRICWAPAIVHAIDHHSAKIFRDAIFVRDPDGTATVQIRSYDWLPPSPTPSRRPHRRVDPLNGHPWG